MIALRNAHLAAELVQRAISNRNKRMALPRLLCAPLALSEADLGVESEGLQSLLAKRREVEEEVSQHHVTPASRDPCTQHADGELTSSLSRQHFCHISQSPTHCLTRGMAQEGRGSLTASCSSCSCFPAACAPVPRLRSLHVA